MKNLFSKIEIVSSSQISKKDKKLINKTFNSEILQKNEDYCMTKLKNRVILIIYLNKALLFYFNGKYIPTIKSLENKLLTLPTVFLDSGAIGPIQRGANVMAPGVFKYINLSEGNFDKNDVLCIKIINEGIIGVGIAMIDKKDIKNNTNGEVVEVLHTNIDELYYKY